MTTKRITIQSWKPIKIERLKKCHPELCASEDAAKQLARLLIDAARGDALDYILDAIVSSLLFDKQSYSITDERERALSPIYRIADLDDENSEPLTAGRREE
jgi:hypothetical protein